MLYLLTLGLAYGQDCATPVTSATLDSQLDSVAMGFLEMDGQKVQSGLQNIQTSIPCLNETLDPIVARVPHVEWFVVGLGTRNGSCTCRIAFGKTFGT